MSAPVLKARLIVREDAKWMLPPSYPGAAGSQPARISPILYPVDLAIPKGWVELEVVNGPTRLLARSFMDFCCCSHPRDEHVKQNGNCFNCSCLRFQEVA